MSQERRFDIANMSFKRVVTGLSTRVKEWPHSIAWNMSLRSKRNRVKILSFQNIHKNERCFIVANGPSLTKTNLDLLENEITFGLNRIYLNFDRSSFRPSYYVAINELVLEQYAAEILKLRMPKFINWNRRSFFPQNDPGIIFLKSKHVFSDSFQSDLTRPMVIGGTVTFATLQLAFYMGFSQVVLVGLDHSYNEKGIPNEKETRTQKIDQSHFHPDYFPKGSKWQLPDLSRSEIDYQIARCNFEKDGREILDATINGKCQIFKKVSFESLF
jgi:hypothetical protein